jgi:hypothetical protein
MSRPCFVTAGILDPILKRGLKRAAGRWAIFVNFAAHVLPDSTRKRHATGTVLGRGAPHGPMRIIELFEQAGGNWMNRIPPLGLAPVKLDAPLRAAGSTALAGVKCGGRVPA